MMRISHFEKSLINLSLTYLLVNIGWGMAWPYLPNYMRMLGGGILFVALLSVLFNITSFFGQYLWGKKSDSMNVRKPFVVMGIFSSLVFFMLMGLIQNAIALLSLRALQGFFTSSQTPAASALVSEMSQNVGQGFAIFNLFSNIGFMAGNFIGGWINSMFPVNYVFIFSAIPFLLSFIPLYFVVEERDKFMDYRLLFRYEGSGRALITIHGLRDFAERNRTIVIFTVSVFFAMVASGMVYSYISLLIGGRFGDEFVGIYFGIDGLFSSFLILPFGKLADHIGSKSMVILGLVTYALTFLLYYYATTFILLLVAAAVSGTKWASYFNSINAYVARMSKRQERATALGLLNSSMAIGWVVGPLMASIFISAYGLANITLIAILPVMIALLIALFVRSDRGYHNGVRVGKN